MFATIAIAFLCLFSAMVTLPVVDGLVDTDRYEPDRVSFPGTGAGFVDSGELHDLGGDTDIGKSEESGGCVFPSQEDASGSFIRLRSRVFDPLSVNIDTMSFEGGYDLTQYSLSDGPWLVQKNGPVTNRWLEDISDCCAGIVGYIPDNAYLVKGGDFNALSAVDGTRWVGPYLPDYKFDPRGWEDIVEKTQVLSLMGDAGEVAAQFSNQGLDVLPLGDDCLICHLNEVDLVKALDHPSVVFAEPVFVPEAKNDVAGQLIGAPQVWNVKGLDGSGQVVGVIDTGLDTGIISSIHPDFRGRLNDIISYPVQSGFGATNEGADDTASDLHTGHGTHVCGSILGDGANSSGTYKGVAPGAELVFQAVEQWTEFSDPSMNDYLMTGLPLDIKEAFQWAYDKGARIHSNSWGSVTSFGQYTYLSSMVDRFMWDNQDFLILYSAGNDGNDTDHDGRIDDGSITPPATAKNCISVAASESSRGTGGYSQFTWGQTLGFTSEPIRSDYTSDNPEGLAPFSSRGPTSDNRIKPDITAPGTNILSVRSTVQNHPMWGIYNESYIFAGGTSMACPITAGAAVLVRQFFTDVEGISPTASLIKATLIAGAEDLAGQYSSGVSHESDPAPNFGEGWGRVNVSSSINPLGNRSLNYVNSMNLDDTGDEVVLRYHVTDPSEPLKVALVWTDRHASPGAQSTLVNDLDLMVTSPDGTEYRGNVFSNGQSIPDPTGSDDVNNVECVWFQPNMTGIFEVTVRASSLGDVRPYGHQTFSLVITGGINQSWGDLKIDKQTYIPGDTITVRLFDGDLNGQATALLDFTTPSGTVPINLDVDVDDPNIFQGHFELVTGSPASGQLHIDYGDDFQFKMNEVSPSRTLLASGKVARKPEIISVNHTAEDGRTLTSGDSVWFYMWSEFQTGWDRDIFIGGALGEYLNSTNWDVVMDYSDYEVGWFEPDGSFDFSPQCYGLNFEIPNIVDGHFNGTFPVFGFVDNSVTPPTIKRAQHNLVVDTRIAQPPDSVNVTSPPEGRRLLINWTPVDKVNLTGYRIYRGDSSNGDFSLIKEVNSPGYLDTGLENGVTYHYAVTAVTLNALESKLSQTVNGTPEDIMPPLVEYTSPLPGQLCSGTVNISIGTICDDLFLASMSFFRDVNGNGMPDDDGLSWETIGTIDPDERHWLMWDTVDHQVGMDKTQNVLLRGVMEDHSGHTDTVDTAIVVDNAAPLPPVLFNSPLSRTNKDTATISGIVEEDARVEILVNGEISAVQMVADDGMFSVTTSLDPGINIISAVAYDELGNGPSPESDGVIVISDRIAPQIVLSYPETAELGNPVRFNGSGSSDDTDGIELNFTWTFTDGQGQKILYGPMVDMVFLNIGNGTAHLKLSDGAFNHNTTTVSIQVLDTTSPLPNAGGDRSVDEDSPVYLSASNSTDNDVSLFSTGRFTWAFSDGHDRFINGTDVVYTFSEPGKYPVSLKVEDRSGNLAEDIFILTVRDRTSPIVHINGSNYVSQNEKVTFSAMGTVDNDRDFPSGALYLWDIDDGGGHTTGHSQNISYLFDRSGEVRIMLNVTDAGGNTGTSILIVNVQPDMIPPSITDSYPADRATGVSTEDHVVISISENLDPTSINNKTVTVSDENGNDVSGSVHYDEDNLTVIFIPDNEWEYGMDYTVEVKGAVDLAGNILSTSKWHFKTTDLISVVSSIPRIDQTDIDINSNIVIVFNGKLDHGTVGKETIFIEDENGNRIDCEYRVDILDDNYTQVTLDPINDLHPDSGYTILVSEGVLSESGNPVKADSWSFSTNGGSATSGLFSNSDFSLVLLLLVIIIVLMIVLLMRRKRSSDGSDSQYADRDHVSTYDGTNGSEEDREGEADGPVKLSTQRKGKASSDGSTRKRARSSRSTGKKKASRKHPSSKDRVSTGKDDDKQQEDEEGTTSSTSDGDDMEITWNGEADGDMPFDTEEELTWEESDDEGSWEESDDEGSWEDDDLPDEHETDGPDWDDDDEISDDDDKGPDCDDEDELEIDWQ